MTATRMERDAFGEIEVPPTASGGRKHSAHSSTSPFSRTHAEEILQALALAKLACALVTRGLGLLRADKAEAVYCRR